MSRMMQDKETRRQGDKETRSHSSSVSLSPPLLVSLSHSKPLRILVAEDNEFNAQLLEQLLGRRGHQVRVANNGREALEQLQIADCRLQIDNKSGRSQPQSAICNLKSAIPFDLMLLDVHMPELDGFQVAHAVRAHEQSAGGQLPIIALTARSRKEDRERCLAAGMDDFLAKPIQAADLWAAIDRIVDARPTTDPPGSGLLDSRVLLAACGGDGVILEKICLAFRARLPEQVTAVRNALQAQDAPRLREAAHKLSGMVAAFSTVTGGVASDLEDRAARGQLEEAPVLVERLETMARELMDLTGGLSLEALQQQAAAADAFLAPRRPY
jgi:two-component system sensor histidine kinase/response regulator